MKRRLIAFLLVLSACGRQSSGTDPNSLVGPVITESSSAGAYISMVAADLTVSSTSLYYYNFATGAISSVSSAEGRDPVALWHQGSKTIVYIVRSTKTFRSFQIQDGNPLEAKSGTFSSLSVGDPTSWFEADGSSGTYLFANLHDKSLRSFEATSGYLSSAADLSAVDLGSSSAQLSPIGLAGTASAPWLFLTGVDFSGVSPQTVGTGAAIKLKKSDDSWQAASSSAVSLLATHPSYAQAVGDKSKIRVMGLCNSNLGTGCKSGAQDLNLSTGAVTSLADLSTSAYGHYSWIVPGSDDNSVYAHVTHTSTNNKVIVKFNLATGTVKEIHTFSDDSLSLLFYDRSGDRLFVGAKEGQVGVLNIYKADALEAKVTTKDLPWHAAAVSSL